MGGGGVISGSLHIIPEFEITSQPVRTPIFFGSISHEHDTQMKQILLYKSTSRSRLNRNLLYRHFENVKKRPLAY